MDGIVIRPYAPADAPTLCQVYYHSVRVAGARHYSLEQVIAWAPSPPDPGWFAARARDGRITLVAADSVDQPLAYGDLECDGHIDHLFCHPDYCGRGIGSLICDRLEQAARNMGIARLYVEASEGARGLFQRKGFALRERRNFELRGVAIHHYRMEKRIDGL